ncbi:MAG: two-component regulator propeller domain-containing protein, partial [Anaerolineae bacterium]
MRHRPFGLILSAIITSLVCLAACQIRLTPPDAIGTPAQPAVTLTAALPTIAPPVEPPTPAPSPTAPGPLALPSPRPTRDLGQTQREWTSFGDHNDIRSLASHGDGSLWAATAGGLVRWDLTNGTSQVFDSPAGLASQHVTALLSASDGSVWAGTNAGLSRYDGSGWVTFTQEDGLPSDYVTLLMEDSDGTLWCGSSEGLALHRTSGWETVWKPEADASVTISAGAETPDGVLWFAGGSAGLLRVGSSSADPEMVTDGPSSPTHLAVDAEGLLWVADLGGGVWRYDGAWKAMPSPGVPEPVVALVAAADHGIWAVFHSVVARLDDGDWFTFAAADGLPEGPFRALAIGFDGYVWCAGAHGLARYDGSHWQDMTTEASPPLEDSRVLLANQNQGLFVGTDSGIGLFADDAWSAFRAPGPPVSAATDVLQATDGSLWFGLLEGGALRYAAGEWTEIAGPSDSGGGEYQSLRLFAPGDATVWLSGAGYLAQLDPISGQVLYESRCLADAHQRPLGQTSDGSVWLATARELTTISPQGVWAEMTAPAAPPPVAATAILQASDDTLWLGTEEGLYRLASSGTDLAWKRATGLRAQAVRDIAEGPDGTLWVAFPTGLGHGDGVRWEVTTADEG